MPEMTPDFRNRTPAIDPAAFATVLQRKAQIDEQQREFQENQKDQRIKGLIDAVVTGQQIASNMMTLAEKRKDIEAKKKQAEAQSNISNILKEPSTITSSGDSQLDTIMQNKFKEDRQKRLISELATAAPIDTDKALLNQAMPKPMTGNAARRTPMALELPDGTQALGVFDPTQPAGQEYRLQDGSVAPTGTKRSYKFDLKENSSGNLEVISGASGKSVNEITTSSTNKEPKKEANNIFVLPASRRIEFVKTVEATKNDPQYRGEIQKVLNASTFERSLAAENQILDSGAALQFRKVFGDSGNISIVEQQASQGDKQIFSRAKQFINTNLTTGKLTEHNRQIMRDGLKVLRESAQKNLLAQTELQAKSMKSQYPELSERLISENILGKGIYTTLKKKYPDISSEFAESKKTPEEEAAEFLKGF